MKRSFLGLLTMARNECPSYREWLAHHRREGFDHFFIIDNDSSESECADELAAAPDVTVYKWLRRADEYRPMGSGKHRVYGKYNGSNQADAYNHFLPRVSTEWVAIWDVDEFGFGARSNESVAEVLRTLPPSIHQICMPWLVFGSGGAITQPACVTATNVLRASISEWVGKCIQRTALIASAQIHRSVMANETFSKRGPGCACAGGARCRCCGNTGPSSSVACQQITSIRAHAAQRLILHHYISQSQEHMRRKSATGEADLHSRNRSEGYWRRIEMTHNFLEDRTLANKSVCAGEARS